MALPGSLGITRGVGWLAAGDPGVFPFGHPDFTAREPRCCSDRIFRSRNCAAFASFSAATALAWCHFYQRYLGPGDAGDRDGPPVRADSWGTFLCRAPALAR